MIQMTYDMMSTYLTAFNFTRQKSPYFSVEECSGKVIYDCRPGNREVSHPNQATLSLFDLPFCLLAMFNFTLICCLVRFQHANHLIRFEHKKLLGLPLATSARKLLALVYQVTSSVPSKKYFFYHLYFMIYHAVGLVMSECP